GDLPVPRDRGMGLGPQHPDSRFEIHHLGWFRQARFGMRPEAVFWWHGRRPCGKGRRYGSAEALPLTAEHTVGPTGGGRKQPTVSPPSLVPPRSQGDAPG